LVIKPQRKQMKQLSGLDATFLYLETPEMPMHVGALHVLEVPPGAKGRFITALRKHVASRLPAAPVLRRRLWWMPLNLANPAWVDAQPDLNAHIVEIKLPVDARKGDGMLALEAAISALHPVLLNRAVPLWKMHVFEGLAPAANGHKRVAVYTQLHHAAVDGQAAVALAGVLLDVSPQPRAIEVRPSSRVKTYQLDMGQMLRGAIGHQAALVSRIVKELPATAGTLTQAARQALAGVSSKGGKVSNLTLAPRTVLNASATTGRAFAAITLPLGELKAMGREHEATLNDMVLWLCSTALRRYFGLKKTLPRKPLIAAVPISLREKGDTTPDNQASMSLISLGTHVADPLKRLAHIKAASGAMKRSMGSVKSILPTDFPSIGVPWLIEAVTALYGKAKVAERIPQVANLVISNVPGPPVPLYLAGALMVTNYPTSIVTHGLGLNITVQSYAASLDFGLMADAQAMPDVRELAHGLQLAFDEMRATMPVEPPAPASLAQDTLRKARKAMDDMVGGVVGGVFSAATKRLGQSVAKRSANGLGTLANEAMKSALSQAAGVAKPPVRRTTAAGKAVISKPARKPRSR
jgi:diacylglycerol O-acyltransferase / wax synthase